MVAQGYAVLLPDPALSTGYGQDFIQRGWGSWGDAPYTDLMAITDAVEARDDTLDTLRRWLAPFARGPHLARTLAELEGSVVAREAVSLRSLPVWIMYFSTRVLAISAERSGFSVVTPTFSV